VEDAVAKSVVSQALLHKGLAKLPPDELRKRLSEFLAEHRNNLTRLTPEMITRDWDQVRSAFNKNCSEMEEYVEKLLTDSDIILLEPVVNSQAGVILDSLDAIGDRYLPTITDSDKRDSSSRQQFVAAFTRSLCMLAFKENLKATVESNRGSLGSVYTMAAKDIRRPFDEKQKQRVRDYLFGAYGDGGVIVFGSLWDIQRLASRVVDQQLGDPPATLTEEQHRLRREPDEVLMERDKAIIKSDRIRLVRLLRERKDWFPKHAELPLSTMGLPPRKFRCTVHAGFNPRELISFFSFWQASLVPDLGGAGALGVTVYNEFRRSWETKINSSRLFGGDKHITETGLSQLEQRGTRLFLEALELPVIKYRDKSLRPHEICSEYKIFLQEQPEVPYVAKVSTFSGDVSKYIVQASKSFAETKEGKAELLYLRSRMLLRMAGERYAGSISSEGRTVGSLPGRIALVVKDLRREGFFEGSSRGLTTEGSALHSAIANYLSVAIEENPLFDEVEEKMPGQKASDLLRKHMAEGMSPSERSAYAKLLQAFESFLGGTD